MHLQIQLTTNQKQYFSSKVKSPRMLRADCMHCSTPFYVGDFSILRFWYLHGSWNLSPMDMRDELSFGRVESYTWIVHTSAVLLSPLYRLGKQRRVKLSLRLKKFPSNESFLWEIYPLSPDNTLKLYKYFLVICEMRTKASSCHKMDKEQDERI